MVASAFCLRRVIAACFLIFLASSPLRAEDAPAADPGGAAPGTAVSSVVTPSPIDHQAAYCLRAEFGFAQRLTTFVSAEQTKIDELQNASADPSLDAAKRDRITAAITALTAKIKAAETERTLSEAALKKTDIYLNAHGLTKGDGLQAVEIDTASAKEDEEESQAQYRGCVANCQAGDGACKQACRKTSDASDASQRLASCNSFVDTLGQ